ncbi:phage portal protein [Natronobacterium gregoryi]|uniref:Portal protein n=2 Tax=Natronobacterium gregoryi TaxID=44930 RepID=L0AN95_NATGS|nr:phage portal protein [Natronobacterium gregoryi]AFZ74550.1 bacteriophage capsid portal protein [Natronobacterium gregoryi SP2]ELY72379.1 portal protein [Natronobacterium gregoryi SP2]PLK21707.1 phage portal protein [Natronobacterium gregoryi SP2]SFI96439.1 phage portal protein, HK97 family [Natronobacterium gregoryi]
MSDAVTDNKVAVNVEGVGKAASTAKAANSTQLTDRRVKSLGAGINPPYNPYRLASFLELNETLATGIRKKSRYEVGYGFDIVPWADLDADEADDIEREVVRWFWHGPDSKWQTKARQTAEPATPEEVKELTRQDYHLIGWCCLEILTDLEGRPIGLAYVPARTVRVRKPQSQFDQTRHPEEGRFVDGDLGDLASRGYVQVRNGERRYFGEAGDRYRGLEVDITAGGDGEPPTIRYQSDGSEEEPVFVDRETGDVVQGSAEGLETAPANELIFITNPSPLTDDYGVPDWISATRTIAADEAAKDYNADFFDNDTIPRFAIKVKSGELTEESKRDLRQMLNGLREESHRTVILEVDKFESRLDQDVEIELEPLGQGISEEMSFEAFREKNESEIAKVLEIPPIKIGNTGTSNRSNSEQQDKDFALEVVQPEQHKFAQRLYAIIHQQALGVTDWTLEYELRGADQPKQDAEVARRKIQAVNGAVPINRALEMAGMEPLPDDHPIGGEATLVANVGDVGQEPAEPSVEEQLPPERNKIGERDWADVEAELAEKDEIDTEQFNSSNLDEGLYDYEDEELYLSFLRDEGESSLYTYVDIPPTEWSALTSASSAGSYHHSNIRLSYAYLEITNFHSRLPEGEMPDDPPDDVPM